MNSLLYSLVYLHSIIILLLHFNCSCNRIKSIFVYLFTAIIMVLFTCDFAQSADNKIQLNRIIIILIKTVYYFTSIFVCLSHFFLFFFLVDNALIDFPTCNGRQADKNQYFHTYNTTHTYIHTLIYMYASAVIGGLLTPWRPDGCADFAHASARADHCARIHTHLHEIHHFILVCMCASLNLIAKMQLIALQ